ncbi:sensor histidine kinase [Daejeonella oryzae]|uniref:sensor histidine kinase n=1 Tax=Daejeonella oryzae TaxID=1122943 RepID=UPI001FE04F17|nr:histidine kinase [Daejeonella oryzae]
MTNINIHKLISILSIYVVACIFSLFQFLILIWFGFSMRVAAFDSIISILLLFTASLLVTNTLKYYLPQRNKYVYILIWCILISAVWLFISHYLLNYLLTEDPSYRVFMYKSLPVRFSVGLLIICLMALIRVFLYTQMDQKEMEQRKAESEKLARDAELYNLRQQLQPHFLFNSLNSITALIGSRPDEARKMIHQLSDFLRGTLKKEDQQPVSLAEELEHLQLYLEIEMVRFGHRLTTEIIADEACSKMLIPPMLLQPIVENAIKFGLYDTTGIVSIKIIASCVQNQLHVSVQNPFDPETSRPNHGTGFGLSGVKRRLHLLFGYTDLLETNSDSHIFTTTVKIPQ